MISIIDKYQVTRRIILFPGFEKVAALTNPGRPNKNRFSVTVVTAVQTNKQIGFLVNKKKTKEQFQLQIR